MPAEARIQIRDLLTSYYLAKVAVVRAGYEHEIAWQEDRHLRAVDETTFLREAAWVVLSSGMREVVIRRVFPSVELAFGRWCSAAWIVDHHRQCRTRARKVFRHERKVDAVLTIARRIAASGVAPVLEAVRDRGPDALLPFPYMGPATSRHLAKNLGFNTAKPDRHLVRVALATGYASPAAMCEHISAWVGDTTAVVDVVIWRFATLCADYLDFFVHSSARASRLVQRPRVARS